MFVPRMSAGIRSGVNWIREKFRFERLGQRPDEQRLAQAGHAFQQAVPADEQAGQHAVHDVVVPDDHAAELLVNGLVALRELLRPAVQSIRQETWGSRCRVVGVVQVSENGHVEVAACDRTVTVSLSLVTVFPNLFLRFQEPGCVRVASGFSSATGF